MSGRRQVAIDQGLEFADDRSVVFSMSCRMSTKQSGPVLPCFQVMPSMIERRRTRSPVRNGARICTSLPAHIRRGTGTGGRKALMVGCPAQARGLGDQGSRAPMHTGRGSALGRAHEMGVNADLNLTHRVHPLATAKMSHFGAAASCRVHPNQCLQN